MAKDTRNSGGEILKDIGREDLYAFYHGERLEELMKELHKIATESDSEETRLKAINSMMDRLFGKPYERTISPISMEEEFRPIIVGNLKGEEK